MDNNGTIKEYCTVNANFIQREQGTAKRRRVEIVEGKTRHLFF